MGHVQFETRNEGRGLHEWDYITLGEERVVRALILNRSKVDRAYVMEQCRGSVLSCSGTTDMAEPILCSYVALDSLIGKCRLTKMQDKVISLLMQGWTETDIAQEHSCSRQAVHNVFCDAVSKIVRENNKNWMAVYEGKYDGRYKGSYKKKTQKKIK